MLAVAQEVNRDETKPKVVNAVTLEVSPEEAEKLDLARSVGSLSLVLRNQVEARPVETAPALPAAPTTSIGPVPSVSVQPVDMSPNSGQPLGARPADAPQPASGGFVPTASLPPASPTSAPTAVTMASDTIQ